MSRRDHSKLNAQYLKRLQDEFKDVKKNEVKDLFTEKGKNYEVTKNALLKIQSKENKENESSSEIDGLSANLLKSFLGQENFFKIEDYIQEVCQKEIQKVNSKTFKKFEDLMSIFSGRTEYSARDDWIVHLHDIHDKDLRKTGKALAEDKVLRNVIQKLYSLDFGENEKSLLKNNSRLIDELVRKRNVPLDRITQLKPDQLIFDLHYFSIEGAKKFVREVAQLTSGLELQLVTGMGLHSRYGESAIKKNLIEVYGDRIRESTPEAQIIRGAPVLDASEHPARRSPTHPTKNTHDEAPVALLCPARPDEYLSLPENSPKFSMMLMIVIMPFGMFPFIYSMFNLFWNLVMLPTQAPFIPSDNGSVPTKSEPTEDSNADETEEMNVDIID